MGHRNAFHVKVDDLTGEVLEGDVGPDGREDDPERGPKGYDEFNLITRRRRTTAGRTASARTCPTTTSTR